MKRIRRTEAQLKSATLAALRNIASIHVLRLQAGVMPIAAGKHARRVIKLGEPGTPDLLVLLPFGRALWLELKTETGKVSVVQRAWHARALKLGHRTHVCRSVDEAVMRVKDALADAWLSIGPYDRPIGEMKAEASNGGRG